MSHSMPGDVFLKEVSPLAQCSPVSATWEGGLPPFEVQVLADGADAPRVVARTNASYAVWTCDLRAGTHVQIKVWDRRSSNVYVGMVEEGNDNCLITNPTAATASTSRGGSSSPAPSLVSTTARPSTAAQKTGDSKSSTPVGAIVGGVVGGVIGLLLLAGLLFWLYRRRRRRDNPEEREKFEIEDDYEMTPITPFLGTPPREPGTPPPEAAETVPTKLREELSARPPLTTTTTSSDMASMPLSPLDSLSPTHAEDAGPAVPEQLPPMYGNWKS